MDPFLSATIGEYRITGLLGEGGMGRVYRARHHRLGRDAAIKVLSTAANDPVFLQRFLNEAQIQARLRDPGIASLYDFTECQGSPVMIMEYIDGETLQQITQRLGRWSSEQALPVLVACARTLEYVHGQGIIHRDLKSANIKISSSGDLKLLDFGIAIPSSGRAMQRLTTAGFVIGTFQSLAPEQVRGEGASQASDVWSFGVLAYEMLTGSLPFEAGSAAELFAKIAGARFTAPSVLQPAVPKDLEAVIRRCLRREAKDRYHSFAEVRCELEGLQKGSDPVGGRARRTPWLPRSPALVAVALAALLMAGVGAYHFAHAGEGSVASPGDRTSNENSVRDLPLQEEPMAGERRDSAATSVNGDTFKAVTIDVFDGSAEVWRDGRRLGATPFTVQEPYGRKVELTLKQNGFRDMAVQFDVGERTSYSYEMQRSANP